MSERDLTIKDRLEDILESIGLIEEWSQGMTELHDFMISPGRVMAFNACVMRLQVIGEHVGKLLKEQSKHSTPKWLSEDSHAEGLGQGAL